MFIKPKTKKIIIAIIITKIKEKANKRNKKGVHFAINPTPSSPPSPTTLHHPEPETLAKTEGECE